jgi:enolase-phosphatase E1
MTLPALHELEAIVVDIEGTTTPISFVYDVLFPFARSHTRSWLDSNLDSAFGRELLEGFREQAKREASEYPDVPEIPGEPGEAAAPLTTYVHQLMDRDSKTAALKSMQGAIWKSGYEDGELQGVVWPDVVEAFERWTSAGLTVWIYSSGSVPAQKLLFGNSDQGNLLHYISGHFDVSTGNKKVAASYTTIADSIGAAPSELLFATDNLDEAKAANEAGWNVVVLRRPGNPDVGEHPFDEAPDFDALP